MAYSATEHTPEPVSPNLIITKFCLKFILIFSSHEHSLAQLVNTLRYKHEGRVLDF